MKILFLNVGGVMSTSEDRFAAGYYNDPELFIPRSKLALLDSIIEDTGARIVVTGNWRFDYKNSEIYEAFRSRGFKSPRTCIVGRTPDLRISKSSYLEYPIDSEITEFLEGRDDIESYVILDDCNEWYLTTHRNHLMSAGFKDGGLTVKIAEKIKDYFGIDEKASENFNMKIELNEYLSRFKE